MQESVPKSAPPVQAPAPEAVPPPLPTASQTPAAPPPLGAKLTTTTPPPLGGKSPSTGKGKIIGIVAACLVVVAVVAVYFLFDPFGWRDTEPNDTGRVVAETPDTEEPDKQEEVEIPESVDMESVQLVASLIHREVELLKSLAESKEVIEWFNDEDNTVKKEAAIYVITSHTDDLLYFIILDSLNEYFELSGHDTQPYSILDPESPSEEWLSDAIEMENFVFTLDISEESVSQTRLLWVNYKVMDNDKPIGIFCSSITLNNEHLEVLDLEVIETPEFLHLIIRELSNFEPSAPTIDTNATTPTSTPAPDPSTFVVKDISAVDIDAWDDFEEHFAIRVLGETRVDDGFGMDDEHGGYIVVFEMVNVSGRTITVDISAVIYQDGGGYSAAMIDWNVRFNPGQARQFSHGIADYEITPDLHLIIEYFNVS